MFCLPYGNSRTYIGRNRLCGEDVVAGAVLRAVVGKPVAPGLGSCVIGVLAVGAVAVAADGDADLALVPGNPGVDDLAVVAGIVDLEVQMVTSAVAGGAHVTDGLTAGDGVALIDAGCILHVGVQGTKAVGVFDDDIVAEAGGAGDLLHNGTGLDGVDGITGAAGDIEAVVHIALAAMVLHIAAVPVAVHGGDIASVLAGPDGREGCLKLKALGAGLSGPDLDIGAIGGVTTVDVQVVAQGRADVVVAIASILKIPLLCVRAVSLVLPYVLAALGSAIGDIECLARLDIDDGIPTTGVIGQPEGLGAGTILSPELYVCTIVIACTVHVHDLVAVQTADDDIVAIGNQLAGAAADLAAVLLVVGLSCPGEAIAGAGRVEQLYLAAVHSYEPDNIRFGHVIAAAGCFAQTGTAVELTGGGGLDCMGVGRQSGQGDEASAPPGGDGIGDLGPVLAVGQTDIHEPQLISSTVDPGITGTLVVAGGLQIGLGVNGLAAGGCQSVNLGVTAGGQCIIGSGGSCAGGANEETAHGREDQQQAEGTFQSFH